MKKIKKKHICPGCNIEREVSYSQLWNIKTGKCSGKCVPCKNNKPNKGSFPKAQIPWNKGLKGYQAGHPGYVCMKGASNPSWKGGITKESLKIRNSKEYALWRKSVFERDDYVCQFCKQKSGKLCADHIKPFSLFPDLRFDINNGRTLCLECHKTTDTYLSKVFNYGLSV